jgi:hypothetical protein
MTAFRQWIPAPRSPIVRLAALVGALLFLPGMIPQAQAGFIGPFAPANFELLNENADGTAAVSEDGLSLVLTGGNNGTGIGGTTDFIAMVAFSALVEFQFLYSTSDEPGFDHAGYLLDDMFLRLADRNGEFGKVRVALTQGQFFGFRVATDDNTGEPGVLSITSLQTVTGVPEVSTSPLMLTGLSSFLIARRWWRQTRPCKESKNK